MNSAGHEKDCIVIKLKKKNREDKSKYEFTCREQFCFRDMWLCPKHKAGNQDSMDRKASDLDQKHGLKLAHFLGCSRPMSPTTSTAMPPGSTSLSTGNEAAVSPVVGSSAFKTAAKKLKKKSVEFSDAVEIVPIPDGEPMFMFQALKGKTKPVNGFYDSGCSNAVLKAGK